MLLPLAGMMDRIMTLRPLSIRTLSNFRYSHLCSWVERITKMSAIRIQMVTATKTSLRFHASSPDVLIFRS